MYLNIKQVKLYIFQNTINMNKLFKLSTEISEMSVLKQKQSKGGWGISLSGLTITAPGGDNGGGWSFPSSWQNGTGSGGGGGGGGGGGENTNPDPVDNINDPSGTLEATKGVLTEKIEILQLALKSNLLPANELKDVQAVIDALQQSIDTITLLENSEHKYRIDVKPNFDGQPDQANGEFTYDSTTGEFVITIEGIDGEYLPVFIHELEHANQLENNELFLNNGQIDGYDINDEVAAYDVQHKVVNGIAFDVIDLKGNIVTGPYEITPDAIYDTFPGMYDHLKTPDPGTGGEGSSSNSSGSSHR